jgi:hypothetical protein
MSRWDRHSGAPSVRRQLHIAWTERNARRHQIQYYEYLTLSHNYVSCCVPVSNDEGTNLFHCSIYHPRKEEDVPYWSG